MLLLAYHWPALRFMVLPHWNRNWVKYSFKLDMLPSEYNWVAFTAKGQREN